MKKSFVSILLIAWMTFSVGYRRTALGPLWIIVGPSLFIVFIGSLFKEIGNYTAADFVTHMAIGLVIWGLIGGVITRAASVFNRNRAYILQANHSPQAIVMQDLALTFIVFLHQLLIIVAVMLYYRVGLTPYALVSLFGLVIILANGYWVSMLLGIVGARFRDIEEVLQSVMRIAFLATPIIWMAGDGGRSDVVGAFVTYNPFYYFVEIFRAPLLDRPLPQHTWLVVLTFTIVGWLVTWVVSRRYLRNLAIWV